MLRKVCCAGVVLFVLAIGVLLPILGIAKSFFFRSSAPKRSS